ncbi:TPA: 3-isopropylmalate dehydratase small subunit [Candidatus Bathyarchaeota archaeon]|nr:3-isopropylmalate dehydratase small subunit [Candidatus Bathyarchaeota archaeon]
MTGCGRTWKFGDDINTDYIIAGKYKLSITDIDELSKHAMEAVMPDFSEKVKKGDFIVAGRNFGCGSSREQAPLVLKHLGIAAVIARSFARIFYRNAVNIGLPVVECEDADEIQQGDMLEVDMQKGYIKNVTQGKTYKIKPLPSELWKILSEGGLVNYIKKYGNLPWQ